MLADSMPAAHLNGDVGTSRLEEQLEIKTKRSQDRPKQASYLPWSDKMSPETGDGMSANRYRPFAAGLDAKSALARKPN